MNPKSPQTPPAVSFFKHFPINFLRPYGVAYPAPTETEIMDRLKPLNCEWFGRPAVAISEFAATIQGNLDLLTDKDKSLIKKHKIASFQERLQPFLEAIKKFNTKTPDREMPMPADVKTFLQTMLSDDEEIDHFLGDLFEIGGAMYILASHFHVIKTLLQNPEWYATTSVGVTRHVKAFKADPTIKGLKEYLISTTCSGSQRQTTERAKHAKKNLAAMLDSDDDQPTTSTEPPRKRKKISTISTDDDLSNDDDQNVIPRGKGNGKGKGKTTKKTKQ